MPSADLDEAATRVLAKFSPDDAKRFDPATILLIISVIVAIFKACRDKTPVELRDAARTTGPVGFLTRWSVRRKVGAALRKEYRDRETMGRWEFRELRDKLADATLAAGRDAEPDEMARVMRAVAAED